MIFDRVVLLSNERALPESDIRDLISAGIELRLLPNLGHDFGMYYRILLQIDITGYLYLALVNDSCILFRDLGKVGRWLSSTNLDYCGVSDSNHICHHVQTFFAVFKGDRSIAEAVRYFKFNGTAAKRENVIATYEIGLSSYLVNKGFRIGAMYPSIKYFSGRTGFPMLQHYRQMIAEGLPMVKRVLLTTSFKRYDVVKAITEAGVDRKFLSHLIEDLPVRNYTAAERLWNRQRQWRKKLVARLRDELKQLSRRR